MSNICVFQTRDIIFICYIFKEYQTNKVTLHTCRHHSNNIRDLALSYRGFPEKGSLSYNELSKKNRFQSVPIAALCLYNSENLVLKILSVPVYSGIDRSSSLNECTLQELSSTSYNLFQNFLPLFSVLYT